MTRTASDDELNLTVREFIRSIRGSHEPVQLQLDGEIDAVVVNYDTYTRMKDAAARAAWAAVDRIHEQNAHLDPDEVYRDVTEVVEEVRRERWEERQARLNQPDSG